MGALPTMQRLNDNSDYSMTLYEVCEFLGKSTRTVSRYIHKNILHPLGIKSRQGTLEYRFSRAEVEQLREKEKSLQPYLYEDEQALQQNYAAASFADYPMSPPPMVQPPQTPYLVPGMAFPMRQGPAHANAPIVWPPNIAQNFNPPVQNFNPPVAAGTYPKKPGRPVLKDNLKKEIKENRNEPAPVSSSKINEIQNRGNEEIISLLKETTGMLRDQLKVKDDQIKNLDDKIGQLIERNRETNILLKGLQDKIMLLEKPKDKSDANQPDVRHPDRQPLAISEAHSENALPKENFAKQSSVKIRILPEVDLAIKQDASDSRDHKMPIPKAPIYQGLRELNRDEPEKKGLFGKIFG